MRNRFCQGPDIVRSRCVICNIESVRGGPKAELLAELYSLSLAESRRRLSASSATTSPCHLSLRKNSPKIHFLSFSEEAEYTSYRWNPRGCSTTTESWQLSFQRRVPREEGLLLICPDIRFGVAVRLRHDPRVPVGLRSRK